MQGTYNDEVVKRLLVLKKLDGYPVIREVLEKEEEEEMTTLDMKEIQNMAEELDVEVGLHVSVQRVKFIGPGFKLVSKFRSLNEG